MLVAYTHLWAYRFCLMLITRLQLRPMKFWFWAYLGNLAFCDHANNKRGHIVRTNFASTLVKLSKLSHIQTTICYATAYGPIGQRPLWSMTTSNVIINLMFPQLTVFHNSCNSIVLIILKTQLKVVSGSALAHVCINFKQNAFRRKIK